MSTNTPVTTPSVQDNPQKILSSLLNWLPLIATITGAVGLVITALVANQLSNELGFPTLLPTIMGNFEVGYALLVFLLSVLIFSAPITMFISDRDRELATFTGGKMWILWLGSLLLALTVYNVTWIFPAQENYFIIGFLLLTCGLLVPWISNNQASQSNEKLEKVGGYVLRGLIFFLFFCMCLISFSIPIIHFVNGTPDWIFKGPLPFHPGMALIFLIYTISALVFSLFYFKSSRENSTKDLGNSTKKFPYFAITLLLLLSWFCILKSLTDKQIQNGILGALNERVSASLMPSAQKTLCGVTASTESNYQLINYSDGTTTYWACYTLNNNQLLQHGTMSSKQFVVTVWPN